MVEYIQYLQYAQYLSYVVALALGFYIINLRNKVKTSVGWNFIDNFSKSKFGNKDLLLRIKSPTGKEYYQSVKQEPLIKYHYFDNDKKIEKSVIYDPKSVDNFNGIPVMNVSPADIRPLDRDLGTLINIPHEVIKKLVTDSTKDPKNEVNKAKYDKLLIYGLVGMGICLVIGLSLINQTNAEVQQELLRCTVELGRNAVIQPTN